MKHEQNKPNDPNEENKESEEESESLDQKLPAKTDSDKPDVLKEQTSGVHLSSLSASIQQSPLPPADMFREYERTLPGSGDRILGMAEKEQNYRINWENEVLKLSASADKRGQWFSFIIAIFCIGVSAFLATYNDQRLVPSILIGVGASTLVWLFIQKKRT